MQLSWYSERLRAGRPGFDSQLRQDIFRLSTTSRLAQRLGHEADYSPPPSAKAKNGAIHLLPHTPSWHSA
jgi:hypothetical protein